MRFRDQLRERMSNDKKFPSELIELLPSGYFEMDRKVVIKLKHPLEEYKLEIANQIAEILPRTKGIWLRKGQIIGDFREPKGLIHLWGDSNPEVRVKENGIYYYFDFTKIMFAKGNVHERGLLPKKIKENEIIVDMFAGIGYFSLGIAKTKKPKKIYAIEWNPLAFQYLEKNIIKNNVEEIIIPLHGDSKEIVMQLAKNGITADRIIMGLIPAPVDAIIPALSLISKNGTVFVYEGVEPENSTFLFDEFNQIAEKNKCKCKLIERRLVKAFKPHEYHVVLEIEVTSQDI